MPKNPCGACTICRLAEARPKDWTYAQEFPELFAKAYLVTLEERLRTQMVTLVANGCLNMGTLVNQTRQGGENGPVARQSIVNYLGQFTDRSSIVLHRHPVGWKIRDVLMNETKCIKVMDLLKQKLTS